MVVKFKDGVDARRTPARARRAARPAVGRRRLEWAGEVAILRDPLQPDAKSWPSSSRRSPKCSTPSRIICAARLTPNDTGYGPRQWNLQSLDMPKAWDINPGANSDLIVAIVDTGVTTFNGR